MTQTRSHFSLSVSTLLTLKIQLLLSLLIGRAKIRLWRHARNTYGSHQPGETRITRGYEPGGDPQLRTPLEGPD
jgi:hypothetical protein